MPGFNCTKYDSQIIELHAAGLSGRQIAAEIGIAQAAIWFRSRVLKLENNRNRNFKRQLERIAELHAQGMTDDEIANETGRLWSYIGRLRRFNLKLPANVKGEPCRRRSRSENTNFEQADRLALAWRLHLLGRKPKEIAAACDVTVRTAQNYIRDMPGWWRRESGVRDEPAPKVFPGQRRGGAKKMQAA